MPIILIGISVLAAAILIYKSTFITQRMIKNNFTLFVSIRYLKSKRYHSLPSLATVMSFLGITISVATLLIVTSVINGFRAELMRRLIGSSPHITIMPPYGDKFITNYFQIVQYLKLEKEISLAIPVTNGQGMIINSQNDLSSAVITRGITAEDLKNKSASFKSFDIKMEDFDTSEKALIGKELAQRLQLVVGDEIAIVTPEITETMIGIIPRYQTYIIGGILQTGSQQFDEILAFIPLQSSQKLYKTQNGVNAIEISVHSPMELGPILKKLRQNPLLYQHYITSWKEENKNILHALVVEKNVMTLILSLFVMVAAFAVLSNMTMMVNDKAKNIAILMTMGCNSWQIGRIFFLTGFIVSSLGTICGIIIGTSITVNIEEIKNFLEKSLNTKLFDTTIYFLSNLPSEIFISDVVITGTIALVLAILSSIIPAIKATKHRPAEALKYL